MIIPKGRRSFICFSLPCVIGWVLPRQSRPPQAYYSTPFEADFYADNPYDDGNYDNDVVFESSSTAVSPDTRLVVGLNKYSHDATICAADTKTGKALFALSKERLSRIKHDSGNVASLVETCLEALDLQLDAIEKVVMNNHHHRILPIEKDVDHLEWEAGLRINGGAEDGYDDLENLLPDARKEELSHHLAHGYSTATQAPFSQGLCIVMDGMGETFRTMARELEEPNSSYTSDLTFGLDSFQCIPEDIIEQSAKSYFDWREAESVYVFSKNSTSIDLRPVLKRFTEENSPPSLYNHGFENMDSLGAVYSRASSHIFGDWNACGKVMGLAPWGTHKWTTDEDGSELCPELHPTPILHGNLYDNSFSIDRSLTKGPPFIARNDPDLFLEDGVQKKRYDFDDSDESNSTGEGEDAKRLPVKVALEAIALANRIQVDLEIVALDFIRYFKEKTGEKNVCLAGGVALNSVLNGRIARELGFEKTFVSPYPGDDGIAVGCCAFGLYGNVELDRKLSIRKPVGREVPLWTGPLSPYLGPDPSFLDTKRAIDNAEPWLEVETITNEDKRLTTMAEVIESGGIVAWYHSRSEIGPRALGHRSILADPRKKELVRFINERVKSRESFRPFAPSVLVEEAAEWFDLGENVLNDNVSPYMSITAMVHEDKRSKIPAVTHVDGSSRLQTVTPEANPIYHQLISKFFELTGVPMVLNTSFNTLPGEPIVESPEDAVRSFLYTNSIELLVMGSYVIRRKKPDLRALLGEVSKSGDVKIEPLCPKRAGYGEFQSSFEIEAEPSEDDIVTMTKVRMPERPVHDDLRNEWFELLDELEGEILSVCDGTVTLNDLLAQYTAVPDDKEICKEDMEAAQTLMQNIVHRLVRLYENTLMYW